MSCKLFWQLLFGTKTVLTLNVINGFWCPWLGVSNYQITAQGWVWCAFSIAMFLLRALLFSFKKEKDLQIFQNRFFFSNLAVTEWGNCMKQQDSSHPHYCHKKKNEKRICYLNQTSISNCAAGLESGSQETLCFHNGKKEKSPSKQSVPVSKTSPKDL